jgi:hypothetical protein
MKLFVSRAEAPAQAEVQPVPDNGDFDELPDDLCTPPPDGPPAPPVDPEREELLKAETSSPLSEGYW